MPRDVEFTLFCTDCKMENYISKKNKKNTPEKVELKKFCARCYMLKHSSQRKEIIFLFNSTFSYK
ncbi:50S ribosomal protein L33 [Mycoplasmopsis bovis]|nr:50S ribosomal protein L33 [Mycoplasmopsis bovis]QQH22319.1 50S ribosomal protein L33 [Mycoplasmopsis bovis]